jgi:EAL domain-containing protein (putative c-di-GMP-specific phosphodiesterase class I)
MCRTATRDAPRQDLAALGKVVHQQPDVLKVDQVNFVDAKATDASPVHAAATAATAHWASILIVITIVSTAAAATALALFIIGCHRYPLT